MIKRINAGKNFFFFFFFGRCFWYSPQAAPWRSQTFPPAPPWQSQGSVSGPARWRSTIPGLISCHSPPPKKNPNSFAALGLWIKRQELECWLLQKWQCHHLNVTSGAQQAVGVSLSVSGRETVSLKCGVLSIVMLRLWECVCMFGMTSSLITV